MLDKKTDSRPIASRTTKPNPPAPAPMNLTAFRLSTKVANGANGSAAPERPGSFDSDSHESRSAGSGTPVQPGSPGENTPASIPDRLAWSLGAHAHAAVANANPQIAALERNADAIADNVLRGGGPIPPATGHPSATGVLRKTAAEEEEEALGNETPLRRAAPVWQFGPAVSASQLAEPDAGIPLDAEQRAFFEPRFNRSFSSVRIHAGGRADTAARSISALAYTSGANIVFRSGAYSPNSASGRELLAHELAHVVQQGRAGTRDSVPALAVSSPSDRQEREAETAAPAVARGGSFTTHEMASPTAIHRKPDDKSAEEQAPALPAGELLDLAMTRMETPAMAWLRGTFPPIDALYAELLKDTVDTTVSESVVRDQVNRLNGMLQRVEPAIESLKAMADPKIYLPGIAGAIVTKVEFIAGEYAAVLSSSYSSLLIEKDLLAQADKDLVALPDFVTQQYLGPAGIVTLIGQLHFAVENLKILRDSAHRPPIVRSSGDPDKPLLDDILEFTHPGSGRRDYLREYFQRDLEAMQRRSRKQDVAEDIKKLSHQLSAYGTLVQAAVYYEQFAYWRYLLSDHPVLDHFPKRRDTCDSYMTKLDNIIQSIEVGWWSATTPAAANITLDQGQIELRQMIESKEFKQDTDDIADRLKTIATVNMIGKMVLVTAASMLVAGVAAAGVAGSLEAAGAGTLVVGGGELVTEALAFTAASRMGHEIAFGEPAEGTFLGDFASNLAMIGALKGASKIFTKAFKAFADPKVYKLSYAAGKAGVGLATIQMFSEAQHALMTGKMMTGEERYRSMIQNVITFASLEAAGFITRPIQERIGVDVAKALGLDKKFGAELTELQSKQLELRTAFDALKRSTNPDAGAVEGLLQGMKELWDKELSLLERGTKRHAISQEQFEAAIKNYSAAGARLQLQLANLGVLTPGGAKETSFRPVAQGVVSYTPGSESVISDFYSEKKGEFKPSKGGGYEGRLPTGEVTFYVPEVEIPKNVASNEAIAKARDEAQRAADTDPVAKEGLDRLKTLLGSRNVDAVLANAKDISSLLLALADPGFKQAAGNTWYLRFASEPAAIDFARSYGADLLRNLQSNFGWDRLPPVLARASAALEGAATPEARKALTGDLTGAKDAAKIDALLGTPAAPKPPRPRPATKQSMGVDRSAASWDVFRKEERKFAEDHGETLTDEQLDIRADLKQVLASAKAGKLANMGHLSKLSILDRYDALAKQSGMAQTWINNARGALSEALFNPGYKKAKSIFLKGAKVTAIVAGVTIPDYDIAHSGFTEWVNQKSDLIDQGTKQKSGAYQAGVDAASKYLQAMKERDALNVPSGDKISLDFVRDPGPVTKARMLDILFGPGSPVYRVRFGTGAWTENPNP